MKLFFRWLGLALLFVCLADVRAQTTPSVMTMQDAATATGNGTALVVGVSAANPGANLGAVGVQVIGTFSATITFEATTDGTNWTAIMATNLNDDVRDTTATAAGHYTILYGSAIRIRARISSYSSGSVTVKARLIPGLTARLTSGGGGGSGTVTSVGWTGGIVSVATATTTPALTVAGTSGGIPYFSSASTWASSAALGANLPVIGGGAGVAPSVGSRSGNTTTFVTTTGTLTSGDCVKIDASGNFIANGSACGVGGGTPGGSDGELQFNNTGAFGGATGLAYGGAVATTFSVQAQDAGQTAMEIRGDDVASPFTNSYPSLAVLHVLDDNNFYQLTYRNDEIGTILNYQTSGGLEFDHYDPSDNFLGSSFLLDVGGVGFNSTGSVYGAIYESGANIFALGASSDLVTFTDHLTYGARGITQSVPATAIADGNVPTSHLHFYLDEAADGLKAKWKESGGTVFDYTLATTGSNGAFFPKPFTFSTLPTISNGGMVYCSDCTPTTPFVDQTCAGSGTGSMAYRLNGAWKCYN